jgi:hypothetical protein
VLQDNHSWLIDTDQDDLGFQVITDLHGGDPTDPLANQEFQEIKENVMREVRLSALRFAQYCTFTATIS